MNLLYVMLRLADLSGRHNAPFFVVGDKHFPPQYHLGGAVFLSLDRQHDEFGQFSRSVPVGHDARRDVGYLAALASYGNLIVDTDDDIAVLG